jgi:hypothetical protein
MVVHAGRVAMAHSGPVAQEFFAPVLAARNGVGELPTQESDIITIDTLWKKYRQVKPHRSIDLLDCVEESELWCYAEYRLLHSYHKLIEDTERFYNALQTASIPIPSVWSVRERDVRSAVKEAIHQLPEYDRDLQFSIIDFKNEVRGAIVERGTIVSARELTVLSELVKATMTTELLFENKISARDTALCRNLDAITASYRTHARKYPQTANHYGGEIKNYIVNVD